MIRHLNTARTKTERAPAMIADHGSRLGMRAGFVDHAEQANVRVRRHGAAALGDRA